MAICELDENNFCKRHNEVHKGRKLYLSQLDSPHGEHYRLYWDCVRDQSPSALAKLTNFGLALAKRIVSRGADVSDDIYNKRLSICDSCEHCDKSTDQWECKLCGCHLKEGVVLPGKARWATENCPIGKWELPVTNKNCTC